MWDDTEILTAFHDAIKSHRFKSDNAAPCNLNDEINDKRSAKRQRSIGQSSSVPDCNNVSMPNVSMQNLQNSWSDYQTSKTAAHLQNGNQPYDASTTSGLMEGELSSLLMAWYQSGYATGRYHTLMSLQQREEQVRQKEIQLQVREQQASNSDST